MAFSLFRTKKRNISNNAPRTPPRANSLLKRMFQRKRPSNSFKSNTTTTTKNNNNRNKNTTNNNNRKGVGSGGVRKVPSSSGSTWSAMNTYAPLSAKRQNRAPAWQGRGERLEAATRKLEMFANNLKRQHRHEQYKPASTRNKNELTNLSNNGLLANMFAKNARLQMKTRNKRSYVPLKTGPFEFDRHGVVNLRGHYKEGHNNQMAEATRRRGPRLLTVTRTKPSSAATLRTAVQRYMDPNVPVSHLKATRASLKEHLEVPGIHSTTRSGIKNNIAALNAVLLARRSA